MTDRHPAADPPNLRGNFLAPVYLWVAGLKGWRALAFCAVLGAFANLAMPPIYVWPAYAVSLTGLLWMLDSAALADRPRRAAFWRVFLFGIGYYLVGMHWIMWAFLVNPGAHLVFIWMPLIALPSILSFVLALCVSAGFRFWSPGPARLIVFAVAFMAGEWMRGSLFGIGGLPWNLPGMIWAPGEAISQSASIWGIYGLSALTVVAMASPAVLADTRPRGQAGTRVAPVIAAAVVFGAIWGWGARRLEEAPKEPPSGPVVRLVDAGVPQSEKHQIGAAQDILDRYIELTGPDIADAPQIIIWPEGALPAYLHQAVDAVSPALRRRKLIIGAARIEDLGSADQKVYNSLAVLTGDSDVKGQLAVYDKHMLVPFGEFMPGANILSAIGLKTLQDLAPGGFEAGPMPVPVRVDGVPTFGPLICYEVIFPGLSPNGDDRPEWLVNISIDAWFGEFLGPAQHAAQARYRAIEEGLPLARVASRGETGMIDAYGRWTARGEAADPTEWGRDPDGWDARIVDARIPAALPATPYSHWRDGLFWLILLGLNLGLFALPRR
jgi:apolipoprotein N-acyltransferase